MAVINLNRGSKYVTDTSKYNVRLQTNDINYKDLDTVIFQKGAKCRIYNIVPCPNVHSIDGSEHDVNCILCDGSGFIDSDNCMETFVLISNQERTDIKNPDNSGKEIEAGHCYGSFISGINLCYFSKIQICDFSMTYYQISQRQEADLDRLHYEVIDVDFLIDKNGGRYYKNRDFEISPDGQIKWLIGAVNAHVPARGTIYSISYLYRPIYRSIRAIHQNRFSTYSNKIDHIMNVSLPEQWELALDFLLFSRKNSKVSKAYAPGEE